MSGSREDDLIKGYQYEIACLKKDLETAYLLLSEVPLLFDGDRWRRFYFDNFDWVERCEDIGVDFGEGLDAF